MNLIRFDEGLFHGYGNRVIAAEKILILEK